MKLNYDCIRDVLLQIEKLCVIREVDDNAFSKEPISIKTLFEALPNYDKTDIYYSVFNLDQAEYICAQAQYGDCADRNYFIGYITYAGHNYLETIRDSRNWAKTKEIGGKIGAFSMNMIAKIAEGIATAYLKQQLGLL